MTHTEQYSAEELRQLLAIKPTKNYVGSYENVKYYSEEITIVRSRTLWNSRLAAVRIGLSLAKKSRVLFLHRSGSKNEFAEAIQALPKREQHTLFDFRQFHLREMTDEIDEVEKYIESHSTDVLVVSDLESAVDSERHKNELVNRLISIAKSRRVCVVVITRDLQKPLAAGKHAKGPLGRLAGMATRILEIKETENIHPKKREKPKVKWQHELDVITSKRCFGKHVWEAAPKADYKMYIGMLTKKLSELKRGKRKVYGIHDVMSKEAIEKRMSEIYADYELEIKELKARV